MPEEKIEMKKLKDLEVNKLKGKLLEVRRIGASPIFVEVEKKDKICNALDKADIPYDQSEIKVEAIKPRRKTWESVDLNTIVYGYEKIAITTKVSGA